MVASGLSTKEAALRLNKSTATVRNQLYEAMRKLDVRTRYELIALLRPSLPAGGAVIAAKGMPTPPAPELLEYAI